MDLLASLEFDETLRLRETHISGACQLHYGKRPVRIVKSHEQYLVNDEGEKFLDCGSRVSNVGHCHPSVVTAGREQMSKVNLYDEAGALQARYTERLLATLPSAFDVCFFTSSGAEANDLALQLAHRYTRRKGVVVVENAFHGAISSVIDISPKAFKKLPSGKKPWVHVVPLPDSYRGQYAGDTDAADKYFADAKNVIDRARQSSGEIGCFISEPIFVVQGTVIPPQGWLQKIYSYIRELGGVTIADEIQVGMGRSGSHFWAFQTQNVIPDILTVGKPMANGYPLGAVITSRKIASAFLDASSNRYCCEPVAASIGIAVVDTILKEKLLANVVNVSQVLCTKLMNVKNNSRIIGDVRCVGFMVGVDIVWGRECRKPAATLAEQISYKLRDRHIIVASEGEYNNVLNFMPPLCISLNDVDNLISAFEAVVMEIELEDSGEIFSILQSEPNRSSGGFASARPSTSALQSVSYFSDEPGETDSEESNEAPNYDCMD